APEMEGVAHVLSTASSPEIRQKLQNAVMKELLGPANGPDEEVEDRRVSERYLVGILAPRHRAIEPEQSEELAQAGPDSPEEGIPDINPLPASTMSPSS